MRKADLAALGRFDPDLTAGGYEWRKLGAKLAERLEADGLVELLPRKYDTTKNRVGRLTDAGRNALLNRQATR